MPKNKRQQEESTTERKFLRSAMQQSANLSTEQAGEITATKSDAILGRNGPTKEDRKGSFYERLIDVLWDDYTSIPFAKKEDFVVTGVINPVREQGGRFMRWDSNKGQYRVMGEDEERDIVRTVMQALRDRRKNTPEKPKKRASAQGIECTFPLRQEADCPEQDCEPLGMSPTVLPHEQKHAEVSVQQANCPEQNCEPFGVSTIALSRWQEYEEAPDQQGNCPEQDGKPPAIDPLYGKKQNIIQPEQPMYTLRPKNLALQSKNDASRMGLSSGMPRNKKQQERSMAERKLLRATQQSANLSTEQEGGVIATKNDAILGHRGPTEGSRKRSFYERLIDVLWDDYTSIPFTKREDFVVTKVINPVREQGGRFIRWDADKQQYSVMEEGDIVKTVRQALRDRRKNTLRTPGKEECAQGVEYMQPLRQEANCPEQDCEPLGVSTVAFPHRQERGKSPDQQTNYSEQDLESLGVFTVAFPHGQERGKSPDQQTNYSGQDLESLGVSTVAFPHGQERGKSPDQQTNYSGQDLESLGVSTVVFPHGQERGKSPDQQTNYSGQDLESLDVFKVQLSHVRERAAALYQRNKYLEQYLESRSLPAVGLSYFWKRAEALYRQAQSLEQHLESRSLSAVELSYRQEYAEAPNQQANCPEQDGDGKLPAIDPLHGEKQDIIRPEQPTYTLQLRGSDAILGCNGPTKADRRGSFYERLIHVLWDEYGKIPFTEKESFAVNRVMNPVREQGGRFMRWDSNKGQYRVMGEDEERDIVKTVMQALRDRRKNMLIPYRTGIYAQSIECVPSSRQEASCPERDLEPLGVSAPELTNGQEHAEAPEQQDNCPERDLEPLGVSAPELTNGQEHAEAPEQQDNCPERDL
jgi:hypothetical protein